MRWLKEAKKRKARSPAAASRGKSQIQQIDQMSNQSGQSHSDERDFNLSCQIKMDLVIPWPQLMGLDTIGWANFVTFVSCFCRMANDVNFTCSDGNLGR